MSAEMLDCPALGCKEEFVGTIARNIHVRREHPGLSPEPQPIEDPAFVDSKASEPTQVSCPDCGKPFDSARKLGPHRNKAHGFRKGQAQGADSPPSPEEPKSAPAAEPEPEPEPEDSPESTEQPHELWTPAETELAADLDAGIALAVITLRRGGVETFESCQGGEGHAYPEPTVRFHGTKAAGWHALSVCLDFALPATDLRQIWPIYDGQPHGPYWELTFKATDA